MKAPRVRSILVVTILLLLGGLAVAPPALGHSPHAAHRSVAAAAPAAFSRIYRFFGTSVQVQELASLGSISLEVVALANFSEGRFLVNAATNTSVADGVIPGGYQIGLYGVVAAGGNFYIATYNSTTSTSVVERVTPGGVVTTVSLPVGAGVPWELVYGNATRLVLAAPGFLVALSASTLAITGNFSAALPAGVSLLTVRAGPSPYLYLGGTIFSSAGRQSIFFGKLDRVTHVVTQISTSVFQPSGVSATIFTVGSIGGKVYAGGGLGVAQLSTVPIVDKTTAGLLYRYDPTTSTFSNRSALLPIANASVWGAEPWNGSLLLEVGAYSLGSSSSWFFGGLYSVTAAGTALTSHSSLAAAPFLTYFLDDMSRSGGWLFLGGLDTVTGVAETVAVL